MQGLGTVTSALLALSLVAGAVAISRYQRLDLERDMMVAVLRSFVQLTLVGYAINLIFGLDSLLYVLLLLAGMVTFAAWTSAGRGKGVPGALPISLVAIGTAAIITLSVLLVLQIVPPTARYLVSLGGMVIGTSMNTTSLTLGRVRDEINTHRLNIEAALALGATSRQAVSPVLKSALRNAMTPLIDSTKTTGIVVLPGAMAGMIIGGAEPLEAVRLQIVVLYMLLGNVSISAILAGLLSYRSFFTSRHQLRTTPEDQTYRPILGFMIRRG